MKSSFAWLNSLKPEPTGRDEQLKLELRELAYQHLEAMKIPSTTVMDVGNQFVCGPEKRFHEGAFLCWAGMRLYEKEKR